MPDVNVRLSGPWFDGGAERVIGAFIDQARSDVADEGANLMHQSAAVFRHPTGNWERHLATDRAGDNVVVSDDVVYNAWLEGVSSRNATTRFKGYRIWRLSTQRLQDMTPVIVERTLARFIGRL